MGYRVPSKARGFTKGGAQLVVEICEVDSFYNIHILGVPCIHILHNIRYMYIDGDSSNSWYCFVCPCNVPDATRSNLHASRFTFSVCSGKSFSRSSSTIPPGRRTER